MNRGPNHATTQPARAIVFATLSALIGCGGHVERAAGIVGTDAGNGAGGTATCGAPTAVNDSDAFDPSQVYVVGVIDELQHLAIAHWSSPASMAVGFPSGFNAYASQMAQVRSTDGRLLYVGSNAGDKAEVHEFRCDGDCLVAPGDEYPADPVVNDNLVYEAECSGGSPSAVVVSPEGDVIRFCGGSGWRDSTGDYMNDPKMQGQLLRVGYHHRALTDLGVLYFGSGSPAPFVGVPADVGNFVLKVAAARARAPDGFVLVLLPAYGLRAFEVDITGQVTEIGAYPPLPDGYLDGKAQQLDACGALFRTAIPPGGDEQHYSIVRSTLDGASEVVFEDMAGAPGELAFSARGLVTGP